MSFKDIFSRALAAPSLSGRRDHEEQTRKIILNEDEWFKSKCCLKLPDRFFKLLH